MARKSVIHYSWCNGLCCFYHASMVFEFIFAFVNSLSEVLLLRIVPSRKLLFGLIHVGWPLFPSILLSLHLALGYQVISRSIHFQSSNSWQCHPVQNLHVNFEIFHFSYSFVEAIAQHLNVSSTFLPYQIAVVLVKNVLTLHAWFPYQSRNSLRFKWRKSMCLMYSLKWAMESLDLQLHEQEFKLVSWFLNDFRPVAILNKSHNQRLYDFGSGFIPNLSQSLHNYGTYEEIRVLLHWESFELLVDLFLYLL